MSKLVQKAKVKTNDTKDSICSIKVQPVRFKTLWASYPENRPYIDPKTGNPPLGYENQCAIKLSFAIHGAGIEMKSFKGATVKVNEKKMAVRAQELANWLKLQPFCGLPKAPKDITGSSWQEQIKNKTGIIFFKDYWHRPKETTPTGDHIDLWNGESLTASGFVGSVINFLRFDVGLDSGIGFSDLGKSTTILFWEIQ